MALLGKRIGLLGGSFNPAHAGHLHISEQAYKRLNLDEVWWLISPQNPLKSSSDMAGYETRLTSTEQFTQQHPWLSFCEIEQEYGLQYTIDTLAKLHELYPAHRFVWLMGSDNLAQFHRWHEWRNILNFNPICILDRAPHSHNALRSPMALAFQHARLPEHAARHLADADAPRWTYLHIPRHRESATRLRNLFGKQAFLQ